MNAPIWIPTAERIAHARLTGFMASIEHRHRRKLQGYAELHAYSVEPSGDFWRDLWDYLEIRAEAPPSCTVRSIGSLPGAAWFPGARLNLAENLLRRSDDAEALIFRGEEGSRRSMTWAQLNGQVASCAAALRAVGVGIGDRVAGYLPNVPEAVVAMLATTAIGAIWCACAPDYGVDACLRRLGQVNPKVLFAGDRYWYAGKEHRLDGKVAQLVRELPSLAAVIRVPYLGADSSADEQAYAAFVARFAGAPSAFVALPFDHPALILFSSGTTGAPKAIVHGAGGTLLQTLKEMALHTDLGSRDRLLSLTTTGWMVWNMMVSALGLGTSLVLYDGCPTHPRGTRLFDLAEEEDVSAIRLVPKLLDELRSSGVCPARTHRLEKLKCIIASSAPVLPRHYEFVHQSIKSDVHVLSPAGGTDVMGSLATGCPVLPVVAGEIQVRSLGMKVEVYDANRQSVVDEAGELVCTQSFPSVPLGFWNDPSGERMRGTYFAMYPNVWRHGDWARITPGGGVVIEGRSDATLNVNGVRLGTSELYQAVQPLAEIAEAAAVEHGAQIALFVRLTAGATLDDALIDRIGKTIRQRASARHVPGLIVAVPELPCSSNGKVSELAIRDALAGKPVATSGLLNPQALSHLVRCAHLAQQSTSSIASRTGVRTEQEAS
ncbi:acetoacetate--CoA ligase [Ramlibacter sp. AN1133]|uniref:acetoacetate--CoA ligase n=1 Tax=Ramlibacter sp. AN1133 TaxID=3133429 RepID=UPI0030C06672